MDMLTASAGYTTPFSLPAKVKAASPPSSDDESSCVTFMPACSRKSSAAACACSAFSCGELTRREPVTLSTCPPCSETLIMRKSPSPSPTLKLQQGRSQEARPTLSSSDCGTPRKSAATAFASSSVTLSAPSSDFAVTDSAEAEYLPSYSSSGNSSSSESMRRSSQPTVPSSPSSAQAA